MTSRTFSKENPTARSDSKPEGRKFLCLIMMKSTLICLFFALLGVAAVSAEEETNGLACLEKALVGLCRGRTALAEPPAKEEKKKDE